MDLSNLNRCFGMTSSLDAITRKIKAVLDEKYHQQQLEAKEERATYDPEDLKINSAPVLYLPNLR